MTDLDLLEMQNLSDEELEMEDEMYGLDDDDEELDDEDFVDLAPLYVQDVNNVGEINV